jgi:pimeloyl-ACP methyl ester carboxylesterase
VLHLRRRGDWGGPVPLIVVPGIDGSEGSVAPIVERLARGRPVGVVDYASETNRTLEGLSAEVADLAGREVDGPFDLLGQSIGTIVAARVASGALPVRRVVLISTYRRARWSALRLSVLAAGVTPRWLFRVSTVPMMKLVCGPVGDGRDHPFFAAVRASDPNGVTKRMAWQIDRDFTADLRAIERPTLVLMGAKDRFVPDIASEVPGLRRVLADRRATVLTIEEAGHVLLGSASISRAVAEIERFLGARDRPA